MGTISIGELRVLAPFPVGTLLDISLQSKANEHALLNFKAILSEEESGFETNMQYQPVSILAGDSDIIFCGIFKTISVDISAGLSVLNAECISNSFLLDTQEHIHLYQDANLSYGQIAKQAVALTNTGALHLFGLNDRAAKAPIIQYMETDWSFAWRIAGLLGTVLLPNLQMDMPHIGMGVPQKAARAIDDQIEDVRYTVTQHTKDVSGNVLPCYFIKVTSSYHHQLGDIVSYQGRTYLIGGVFAVLVGGMMRFTYWLGQESGFSVPPCTNNKLKGATLPATVIAAKETTLQVRLQAHKTLSDNINHWFNYVSAASSALYSMPLPGETVMLSFYSHKDEDCAITQCKYSDETVLEPLEHDHIAYMFQSTDNHIISMVPDEFTISEGTDMRCNMMHFGKASARCASNKSITFSATENIEVQAQGGLNIFANTKITAQAEAHNSAVIFSGNSIQMDAQNVLEETISSGNSTQEERLPLIPLVDLTIQKALGASSTIVSPKNFFSQRS